MCYYTGSWMLRENDNNFHVSYASLDKADTGLAVHPIEFWQQS